MADFSKAFQNGRRVALPTGDVRWMMSGQGWGATSDAELRALWWVDNAGCDPMGDGPPTPFRGVRLWLSIRDANAAAAVRLEVWTQPARTGGGILLETVDVAPVAGMDPSLPRDVGVWGVPLENLGVRARVTAGGPAFQLACEATFYRCSLGASGRLWLGQGVTTV